MSATDDLISMEGPIMTSSRELLGIEIALPKCACDCHFHYLGREEQLRTLPAFRAAEDHSARAILARQDEVGIERGVLARRPQQPIDDFLQNLKDSRGRWR